MTVEIRDNLLVKKDLTELENLIYGNLPWYLNKEQVTGADDGCWFSHIIYDEDVPKSDIYNPVMDIFKNYLKYVTLIRINANLLLRQETPSISDFHTDCDWNFEDEEKMTTAIFYLNTNNGVTEFKDGDRIDSVKNRLIIFPTTASHRAIGQTDVSKRIVFNFNFIKRESVTT
tara:strand:- start:5 stop:523 length:519 start_codon:yes stop_codon:yes gene_type:complete